MSTQNRKRHMKKSAHAKKKGAPTNKQLATRIRRLQNQQEIRFEHGAVGSLDYSTAGGFIYPMQIAAAVDIPYRIGNEVIAKYCQASFTLSHLPGATGTSQYRIVAFWDNQSDGNDSWGYPGTTGPAVPTTDSSYANALFDNTVITNKLITPFNPRTKDRYKILKDKVYHMDPFLTGSFLQRTVRMKINLGNAKIKYGTGNNANNIVSKQLVFFLYNNTVNDLMSIATTWFFSDP